ncbi:MAG: hypothetical protein QOJ57_1740 [Thermoleophilaceae bacterium]|jgi:hypothetical protein|nr:hypothetical protein [Thermoleophilaceae bacterium]
MPATRPRSCATAALATVAAIAAVGAPAAAEAKPKKQPVYELQIRGSEAVAWHYSAPADGCFYGATGDGAQEVSYSTPKIKVQAVRPKAGDRKGLVQFALLNDTLAQYGAPQGIPAVALVERDGEIKSSAGCGGTGGSTQQPPPKDCGLRYGRIVLKPGFHALVALGVDGHYDNFSHPAPGETDDIVPPVAPPASGEILGAVYENCPLLLPSGSAPAHDDLTTATKQITASRLPKKGKTLKISAGDQSESADPDGQRTSQTSVAWNLKLKRIK